MPFFGGRPRRVRPHPTPRRCAEPLAARASVTRPRAGPARRICCASLAVPPDDLGLHARCGRFFRCSPDALLPTNRSPAAHRLRSRFRSFRVLRIHARRSYVASMPPSKRKAAGKITGSSARQVVAASAQSGKGRLTSSAARRCMRARQAANDMNVCDDLRALIECEGEHIWRVCPRASRPIRSPAALAGTCPPRAAVSLL